MGLFDGLKRMADTVKDVFVGAGEAAFSEAGAGGYVLAAGAIGALNRGKSSSKLDAERKRLLRPDFGGIVDDVNIKYSAQMVEFEVLGQRIGANPAAQTFGTDIYLESAYRGGDAGQLALLAHELVHTQQFRKEGSLYGFGKRYFREYFRAGFDYASNEMEREADQFAACFMHRAFSAVQYANVWRGDWAKGWSSVTAFQRANEPYLQLYNKTSGAVKVVKVKAAGDGVTEVWAEEWSSGWTSFMPFTLGGVPHCLSCKTSNGLAHFYRFDANGWTKTGGEDWASGWSSFVPFVLAGAPFYLAYKSVDGKVSIGKISADGKGADSVWSGDWSTGWTTFYPFVHAREPYFLAYKRDGGRVEIFKVNAGGKGVTKTWDGDWSSGWTTFLPLSADGKDFLAHKGAYETKILNSMMVYIPGNGLAHVSRITSPTEGTDTRWCSQWKGSWRHAAAFPLNGAYHTVFYGADEDLVSISKYVPN
jgi:hypothetical protein